MFIVFDLDGTLALNDHRQHFVDRPVGKKDWKSFFEACDGDLPNWPIVHLAIGLAVFHEVEIWSGRSDDVDAKTTKWLNEIGLGGLRRLHRTADDRTSDVELKLGWLRESSRRPVLVFEDRDSVVAMWRAEGIVCCQVAPGAF